MPEFSRQFAVGSLQSAVQSLKAGTFCAYRDQQAIKTDFPGSVKYLQIPECDCRLEHYDLSIALFRAGR